MADQDLESMVPSWEDIKYFLVVAETGTLSAAARKLGVNHTTVGRRVAALEGRLNTDFFDRRDNRMILTAEGRVALENAERMREAAGMFHRTLRNSSEKLAGTVSLNVTEGLANFWLMPRMQPFEKRYPALDLKYVVHNNSWDVLGRGVDMALRWSRPDENAAVGRKLGTVRFVLFATTDYKEKYGYPSSEADFGDHSFLHYTGYEINSHLERWCNLMKKHPPAMKLENSSSTSAAIESRSMLMLMPVYSKRIVPGLVEVPLDMGFEAEVWLCYHEDRRKSARVQAVADEVERLWKADTEWFC